MLGVPKYSRIEIERRWLVDESACPQFDDMERRVITDLYIDDTFLRLRKVEDLAGNAIFKLGKKYRRLSPTEQPVTSLYLSEIEYLSLSRLPGRRSVKYRYTFQVGSIDRHATPQGPTIFEVEFQTAIEAQSYIPPPLAICEVTNDPRYSGFAVALSDATN
jgi:hypothetical protein